MEEFEEQTKSLKKNSELTERKKVIVNNFLNVQFICTIFIRTVFICTVFICTVFMIK